MKSLFAVLLALMLVCQARAEMKIPNGVFRIAKLEEAVKLAKEQKKPLAVVASEEKSKDMAEATEDIFKSLTDYAVVVYVNVGGLNFMEMAQLSPPLYTEMSNALIPPKVLIGSPFEDEPWVTVESKALLGTGRRKALREAETKAKAKSVAFFAVPNPGPSEPGDKELKWAKSDGNGHYTTKFVRVEGEEIIMSWEGREGGVAFDALYPSAVRWAKSLKGSPSKESAEEDVDDKDKAKPAAAKKQEPGPMERWTNKDGKALEASFIKLDGDKVTLRNEAGKEFTVSIFSLSLTSQVRARERAAAQEKKE
jgi:hypothetical protein